MRIAMKRDRTSKGILLPPNVNYHQTVKLYSSSLGAVHLAYHETKQAAIDCMEEAKRLYKNGDSYKHLIEPINSEIWNRIYP
jgi:hypothetical protein